MISAIISNGFVCIRLIYHIMLLLIPNLHDSSQYFTKYTHKMELITFAYYSGQLLLLS